MSHRERIMAFIEEGKPEVNNIYQGTFRLYERMLLWDLIEKIDWVDISQNTSEEDIDKCYKSFFLDFSKIVEDEKAGFTQVNLGGLRATLTRGKFMENPRSFVEEMADMINKENDIIKKYDFEEHNIPDFKSLNILSQINTEDSTMETLKTSAEDLILQLRTSFEEEKKVFSDPNVHSQSELRHCENVCQVCCGLFTSFLDKMEMAMKYLKEAKRIYQKKLTYDSLNLPLSEDVMFVEDLDENFKIFSSTLLSVRNEIQKYEPFMYEQNQNSELYLELPKYKRSLEAFLDRFLQMCVLTIKCPVNQYHKTGEASSKKEKEESGAQAQPGASRKKAVAKKIDKKEKFELNSTLKVLGAQSFGGNLRIVPEKSTVIAVDESQLPESLPEGTAWEPAISIMEDIKLSPNSSPTLHGTELTFYCQEMSELTRNKGGASSADKESMSGVCANFFRFCYKICIEIDATPKTLHAFSHPIGWRTGSAQLHPFRGSLTWYNWNVHNVYETFRIPQTLPINQVLDMLDAQISNIKDETVQKNAKFRGLSNNERKFLQTLLLGSRSTSETVYLKDFICASSDDKKKRGSSSTLKKKRLSVDFHTWFYALLRSLNDYMKALWLDRVIYGICSAEETTEILRRQGTQMGTIMLRPSITKIQNIKSVEPRLDLALDFNTNQGSKDVESIYWDAKQIKYLPDALLHEEYAFKAIQGVNNRQWPVKILRNYFSNDEVVTYRETKFKVTMSLELCPNSENKGCESSDVSEKKMRATNSRQPSIDCISEMSPISVVEARISDVQSPETNAGIPMDDCPEIGLNYNPAQSELGLPVFSVNDILLDEMTESMANNGFAFVDSGVDYLEESGNLQCL